MAQTRSTGEFSGMMAHADPASLIDGSSPRIGFGTGGLLRIGSARQRHSVLDAALACGITHFDTAPIYGFGESERALGRILRPQRHRLTLTTKFGLQPSRLAARLAPLQKTARRAIQLFPTLRRVAVRNSAALYAPPFFSVATVRSSLEASLRALRTDYVDFFLAHQASVGALPAEDVVGLLEELRRDGKIRAFGVATDFDWLAPVLQQRPQLSQVVQFDNDLTSGNVAKLPGSTGQLVITYGFIGRSVAGCRARLSRGESRSSDFDREHDDTLGGWLLRAAVLANPRGLVLMQSRSTARIEHNVRAASHASDDDRVRQLIDFLGPRS
jgi:D-threo-aldose 1-dehydrogenase